MPNQFSSSSAMRVNDPVITQILHGYTPSEGIAGFIAPTVSVDVRAGKTIQFGKEGFAVLDLARAPGTPIKRVTPNFDVKSFYIEQHAVGAEVTREQYEEAAKGEARLDLRIQAALRAAAALEQSWESRVIQQVYNPSAFETNCQIAVGGAVADYDNLIQDAQEAIRSQIGRYANSAVIGSDVYRYIRRSSVYRDRVKYTSSSSINQDMIASWWDLVRGVRVAKRQRLNASTGLLEDMVPAGSILLFYSPEGAVNDGFLPAKESDRAEAALAYTYQLNGYPIAEPERFDDDRKVFVTDLIAEQSVQVVGLGATGKVGAGALITGITA